MMQLALSPGRPFERWDLTEWVRLAVYLTFLLSFWAIEILNREFVVYQGLLPLSLVFLMAIGAHLDSLRGLQSPLRNLIPFVDQLVIVFLAVYFLSASPVFFVLTVFNILLASYLYGPQLAIKLGVFAVALFNFCFLWLQGEGLTVSLANQTVFALGILVSSVISGGLSSELQSLEKDLRVKEKDLATYKGLSDLLVENIGAGVLAVDRKGKVAQANRGAMKIFEALGLTGMTLAEISEPIWEYTRSSQKTETYEIEHRNLQGQLMVLEVVISPLRISREMEYGWVVLVQNRTEIKNLEAALRQKDKLAAVGQLAAGIAHEIRNPLASISGSVQLLAGTLDTATPEDKKLLAIIIKEIDRLNDLITEFLEYVRPESDLLEDVSLNQLIGEVLDQVKADPRLSRDVSQVRLLESEIVVRGNYDKMKQAFLNLVINAYQAMEKSPRKELRVHVAFAESQEEAQIRISDTGVGISKDQLRRIFEPFHTTKPKGTGLGLAITHKVFESLGADIAVTSQVGEGTEFTIRMPGNKV